MEIMIPCTECALAAQVSGGEFGPDGILIQSRILPVQENNPYRAVCPEGHQLVVILDNFQFQLLFESGLEAFVDGYFRESVSSFAAALERLYEFSIRVQLTSENVDIDEMEMMWKSVAAQSERQLGMYIGMRTLKEGKRPPTLPTRLTTFRNSVIHKGNFPDSNQAFEFGEAVFGLILDEVIRLDEHYKNAVIAQTHAHRKKALQSLKQEDKPYFLFFGFAVANRGDRSFSEVVAQAQESKRRRLTGDAPPAPNTSQQ